MRIIGIIILVVLTGVIMTDVCPCQEASLVLNDGTLLTGKVVETYTDGVAFEYGAGDAKKTSTFHARELDPHSFYAIRSQVVGDDVGANIELAKFALEHEMFSRAYLHYKRAEAIDPVTVGKFRETEGQALVEGAAAKLLDHAEKAIRRNDRQGAAEYVNTLLTHFAKTEAAKEAQELIKEVGNEILEKEAERQKARNAEEGATPAQPNAISVLLRNGESLRGLVLGTTADSIKLQVPRGGGRVTVTLKAEKVDPYSFFKIRRRDIGEDVEAHLGLARYAIDNSMYAHAYFMLERARFLDPEHIEKFEKGSLPVLREEIAADLLSKAQDAMAEGDLVNAERDLAAVLIRFENTEAAQKARSVMDQLGAKFTERDAAAISAKVDLENEEARKAEEELLKLLDPARKVMEQARKANHAALKDSGSTKAKKEFLTAASRFERAISMLEALAKREADKTILLDKIAALRDDAVEGAVGAYVSAGNFCISRNSFTEARKHGRKALSLKPDSRYVEAFLARVDTAEAAAANWDNRWRVGRGRRGF